MQISPSMLAHSPYYQPMLDSIVVVGKGFKGPSMHDLEGISFAERSWVHR
jgi:hypothetical protein